jgi:hypothetical protein
MVTQVSNVLRSAFVAGLVTAALAGCNGQWFGAIGPEGVIKYSPKPYTPPVYAPVTGATPQPFVPDQITRINPLTGQRQNVATGAVVRGSANAPLQVVLQPDGQLVYSETQKPTGFHKDAITGQIVNDKGELFKNDAVQLAAVGTPLEITLEDARTAKLNAPPVGAGAPPSFVGDLSATVTTVEGTRINYVDAGSTIFVETKGLKPSADYVGTLVWPNGVHTVQPLKSTAGGNISGAQGNFIEYPHVGFYEATMVPGQAGVVTGNFRVEISEKDGPLAQTINFTVRPRPVIFAVSDSNHERVVFFSDRTDQIKLHGEGLWVVSANINRFTQLQDGMTLGDKTFEGFRDLRVRTNDVGVFDAPLLSWPTRAAVTDSLVVIGKLYNDSPTYIAAQDIAISDHPTFLIKKGSDFFGAMDPAAIIRAPNPTGATPMPPVPTPTATPTLPIIPVPPGFPGTLPAFPSPAPPTP